MTIAYICHRGRYTHEYSWFAHMTGVKVKFIGTDEPPDRFIGNNTEFIGVPFEEKGWENKFFAQTATVVYYKDFEKYLEDVDIVVVMEVFSSLSKQFVKYCRSVGKPVIALVYELIAEHPIYKLPRYRTNARYVIKHSDKLITISDAAGDHLVKLGADRSKVKTIYPGVDLKLFKPQKVKKKSPGIIFVGKLDLHKGIDNTIDAYNQLLEDFPDLRLTIIGDGSWAERCKQLASDNPLVSYHKMIPNPELPKYLNQNDIYILPSRDSRRLGQRIGAEQFGFSIVEAMACGLAVITSDCGALPEIVTSRNIVCRQGDTQAFYLEMKKLLKDPERIKKLGQYNKDIVAKRYDIVKEADKLKVELAAIVKTSKS